VADPVLERDLQSMDELEAQIANGSTFAACTLRALICEVAAKCTKWQWIIHGDTIEYRKTVVRWLCMEGKYKLARRFAMCGRGDAGFNEYAGPGMKVVPMGCGARFCPRCSRRFGRRFLSRVGKHLTSKAHGEIWHVVLTQRVDVEETLGEAKGRFEKSWKRFYPALRRMGMRSALCTYHVTRTAHGGWHYHCHVVVEWDEGVQGEAVASAVDLAWHRSMGASGEGSMAVFCRRVCEAGAALVGFQAGSQLEFWSEGPDAVEVALQYAVRDVLQGVEKWISGIGSVEDAGSFAEALTHAKLHRLYGEWRKELPAEGGAESVGLVGDDAKVGAVKGKKKEQKAWELVGRMDEVLWRARGGDAAARTCVSRLIAKSSSRGAVASRLKAVARAIAI